MLRRLENTSAFLWFDASMNETPSTPPAEEKSPLKSKTIWLNGAALLSMLIPAVREFLEANPVEFVSFLTALGVVVRFVTSGKVRLFGLSNSAANLLVLAITGLAAFSLLTSCADYRVTGSAYYRDADSGAKGGMRFLPGAPPLPFFRVPIETENGSGLVEIRAEK